MDCSNDILSRHSNLSLFIQYGAWSLNILNIKTGEYYDDDYEKPCEICGIEIVLPEQRICRACELQLEEELS